MNITYKIISNGYQIYRDGNLWIQQGEISNGYFPYRINTEDGEVDLEQSCLSHIDSILAQADAEVIEKSQLDTIEANTSYLVMLNEEVI